MPGFEYSDVQNGDVRILLIWNPESVFTPNYATYSQLHTLSNIHCLAPKTWADFCVAIQDVMEQQRISLLVALVYIAASIGVICLVSSSSGVIWAILLVGFCVLLYWLDRRARDRDRKLEAICQQFDLLFQADGFTVHYRIKDTGPGDCQYIHFERILP